MIQINLSNLNNVVLLVHDVFVLFCVFFTSTFVFYHVFIMKYTYVLYIVSVYQVFLSLDVSI